MTPVRTALVLTAGLLVGAWCAGWVLLWRHGPPKAACEHRRCVDDIPLLSAEITRACTDCGATWTVPRREEPRA